MIVDKLLTDFLSFNCSAGKIELLLNEILKNIFLYKKMIFELYYEFFTFSQSYNYQENFLSFFYGDHHENPLIILSNQQRNRTFNCYNNQIKVEMEDVSILDRCSMTNG